MFKNKAKFQDFAKRQIAMILAIVMAFSSFASTGMAITTAHAETQYVDDHGEAFVDKLIEITAAGVPYVWGGWQYNAETGWGQVDCRGFVRVALRDVYGLSIFETCGYLVDDDGNPIDKNGNKVSYANRVMIDVAAYDALSTLSPYVGKRICVEGNGLRTYFRVAVADYCYNLVNDGGNRWDEMPGNALDISFNGSTYSSLIAYACQYPGSIIRHNGHYGVGIGEFHSKQDIIDEYPDLDGDNSGSSPSDGIIRWSQSAYSQGNTYSEDDARYWFGKTVFLSACSSKSGIRADNFTTTGKSPNPDPNSHITILLCESQEKVTKITFEKIDAGSKESVAGAKYGIYTDAACSRQIDTFETTGSPVELTLKKDVYYVKELIAPSGYALSSDVVVVDASGASDAITVTLSDSPVHATVLVRKVDAADTGVSLQSTKLKIQEYDHTTNKWVDLVDLKHDVNVQAFTISTSYTDSEGVTYDDGALHYSQTNKGDFKLVEVSAQTGYINGGYTKTFNILTDGSLRLTGSNAIKNTAKLALLIKKVDVDGNPLAGAEMRFEYNGQTYKGTTDEDGELLFKDIPEGATNIGTLYEDAAPEGYEIFENYLPENGQSIALTKSKLDSTTKCFLTTVTVVNGTPETPPPEPTEGTIIIRKRDGSRRDDAGLLGQVYVPNTYYTIYEDINLQRVASNLDGNRLDRLMTDENGTIEVDRLALGVYYVREVQPPVGYAIQPKTFTVNLLSGDAVLQDDGTMSLVVEPYGFNDPRQAVQLSIQKVDELSGKPVAGAVYALYAASDLDVLEYDYTVKASSQNPLGYYVTDENGMITVDRFGTAAFQANGKDYPEVIVEAEGGQIVGNGTANGSSALPNGNYYFVEDSAPNGYVLNTDPINISASWKMAVSAEDEVYDDGVVSGAGRLLVMNTVVVNEQRQTVTILFRKTDSGAGVDVNSYYELDDYDTAVVNEMAATLEGAVYHLVATSDTTDPATGTLIPAGTVVGVYTTNANGMFIADYMTVGAYANHHIPNGTYKFVEVTAPQGYTINETEIYVDATWTAAKSSDELLGLNAAASDEILKQSLTINKVANTGATLEGVSFKVYNVASVLEKCGITYDELPWDLNSTQRNGYYELDRTAFASLMEVKGVEPAADANGNTVFVTDANGSVTTGAFVYGDYIVHEVSAPEGYTAAGSIYIQLPWVEHSVEGGADDDQVDTDVEPEAITVYLHDVTDQPTEAYVQSVVNDKIPEKTTFSVNKVWVDNDDQYGLRPDRIVVQLYADGVAYGNPISLTANDNWATTWTNLDKHQADGVTLINYTVSENAVPYYTTSIVGGTITNTCTYTPPETTDFTVEKVWDDDDDVFGVRPESIDVYLYADGEVVGSAITLNEANNWTYTWTDLLKYDAETSELIEYTVDEPNVPDDYDKSVNGGVITNTCTYVPTTEFSVKKVWNDNDDKYGLRPSSIQVQLYANSTPYGAPIELTADNNWEYAWSELPMYEFNTTNVVTYSVDEVDVPENYTKSVSGRIITNTCTYVPKTTFSVNKVWDDNDNQYGLRPNAIIVRLYANGEQSGSAVMLSAANGWKYTWTNLTMYDSDDNLIVYTVDEDDVDNYSKTIVGGTITNTCTYEPPELVDFTVVKQWVDGENMYNVRPTSVSVQLYADGVAFGEAVELNASNNWTYTWTDLYKHDGDVEIEYSVDEVEVPEHYEKSVVGGTITNTCTYVPTTTFTVHKNWVDNNDLAGVRPDSVTVQLYADGVAFGDPVELSQDNNWSYTWSDLTKYVTDSVDEIDYTVDELTVLDDYDKSINGNVITNTYIEPEKTSFTVVKVWNDHNNRDGLRTNSVNVQLYANGQAIGNVISLTEAQNWSYTWTDLLKYDDDDNEVIYTVDELVVPDNYVKAVEGGTITNTSTYVPTIDITIIKVWEDNNDQYGLRPESVAVQVNADGQPYGEPINLSNDNGWTITLTDLPKYNDDNEEIVYSLDELSASEHYVCDVEDFVITNTCTYVPPKIDYAVQKKWDDNNNKYGFRPNSISVQLYADGIAVGNVVSITAAQNWEYTWTDLEKYSDGVSDEIEYSVREIAATIPEYYESSVSGNIITNTCTYVPPTVDFTVVKEWEDNDDEYGLRPNNLLVQLYADGQAYGDPVELSDDNSWAYTWIDLPKYSDDIADEIVYSIDEVDVPEYYEKSIDGGVITNVCTYVPPEKIDFTVNKQWNDNDDFYGLRPNSITVQLYADGVAYGPVVSITEAQNWSYTWVDLLKHSDDGVTEIVYTVNEINVPEHYEKVVVDGVITNTCTYEPKTTFTVEKIWDDNNNQYGLRPNSITVKLYANGQDVGSDVTLSAANGWTYTWSELVVYENGELIEYTVDETSVPENYEKTVNDGVITNTCTYEPPEMVEFTVEKVWDDGNNMYGVRPENISVQLYADGKALGDPIVLSASNSWTYTWTDLYKHDDTDNVIDYTVDELVTPEHYSKNVDGGIITNTCTYVPATTYTVIKNWVDNDDQAGVRPDGIFVQLYADGVAYGEPVELSQDINWSYTWNDLTKYIDKTTTEIVYTVDEIDVPDDYVKSVNGNIITNTYVEPEKTSFTVVKVWNDHNDRDGLRPDSITVQLYANGKAIGDVVVLTENNNWFYTWADLMKYDDDDNEIAYSVDELAVPDNYVKIIEGGTITNVSTYVPTIDITIAKVWEDNDDQYGLRPDSVLIQLLADGQSYGDPVEVSKDNNWTTMWSGLPRYNDSDVEIVYSIVEVTNIDHYTSEVDGFTVTNTCTYVPPTVNFTVSKVWDDDNDVYGLRPNSISVQLYADGVAVGNVISITAAQDWSYTWTDLAKYADGVSDEIVYTVDEVNVPEFYNKHVNGGTITNTCVYVPEKTDFTVEKIWNDNDNQYSVRPNSIDVYLYADGAVIDTVTLSDDNSWSYTWSDLTKFHDDRVTAIVYTVDEAEVPEHYTKTVVDGKITNTCEYVPPIVTQVIVSKYEVIGAEKKAVPGATLQILDINKNVVVLENGTRCEWVTDTSTDVVDEYGVSGHLIDNLPAGTYYLHEAATPVGYATSPDVEFIVENTNDPQYASMIESPLSIRVSKIDAESDLHLIGATLAVVDADGNIVKDKDGNEIKWETTGSSRLIQYIPAGTYYLRELNAPMGYQKANDIEFTVDSENNGPHITMEDERTYGILELTKYDEKTNDLLQGVVFHFISVDDVVDPITGNTIYSAGEIVDILTTDENGYAKMTKSVPIGTYDANGFVTSIKYQLVEVSAAGGQYDPTDVNCVVEFVYTNDTTPVITNTLRIANNKPVVSVTKTGTPITFVGNYNDRHDVTVLQNGDRIEYVITVTNSGAATAYNVVVRDAIPTNTRFVDVDSAHNGEYDSTDKVVYWNVETIPAGGSVELKFSVLVDSEVACEIVNIAQYAMPDVVPTKPEDYLNPKNDDNKWIDTDAVVHQTVEFHKMSTVEGGTSKDNATNVVPGDTIHYRLTFKAIDDVYDLVVSDIIPNGLTYVSGSAAINGNVDDGATHNPDTNILTFSELDIKNEEIVFEFDVIVDDIQNGEVKYYENIAFAKHSARGEDGEAEELISEIVTHRAEKKFTVVKHGTPITFEGNAAEAHDMTVLKAGEQIEYTLTAINDGASTVKNVVIVDSIPDGVKYLSHETSAAIDVWVDVENGTITWLIPEVAAGESASVKFVVEIEEQKAQLIVNSASYGSVDVVDDNAPTLPENSLKTNDVVHQVIEFHKTSEVVGGKDKNDATAVAIGDNIIYTLELITKGNLTNVSVSDMIPDGLQLVPGSICVRRSDENQWTSVDDEDVYNEESELINFADMDLDAGTYYFRFSVVVEHIAVNTEKFYINQAEVKYDREPNPMGVQTERDSLISEEISHMTIVRVDGNKTAELPTYVGDYDAKHHVTVVSDGDNITYVISVSNMGASVLKNVVIRDSIPEFTKFVSAENDGVFYETENYVEWLIPTIKAGETVEVKFVVKCDTNNTAQEIRNKAAYAVPENPSDVQDDEWVWTDEVIYQTVAIDKSASIKHGVDGMDAKYVPIGTQFTYFITFYSTNDVYGLTVEDIIPRGLSFVEGTATYTPNGGEPIKINDLKVDERGALVFPTIDEVPSGKAVFAFDVKVENVAEYDRDYFFINKATATVHESENSDKVIDLETNTVSNKTIKTNETKEPVLGFESMSESAMWSLIAITSAIAMVFFGAYGFSDQKKKKK